MTSRDFRTMLRHVAGLAVPVTLAQAAQTLGGFVNSLMLARVSEDAFAAGMLAFSIQLMVIVVSISVLFSLSALISQILGEQTAPERVGRLFAGGVILALAVAVVDMAVLWNVGALLRALGQPPVLAELCGRYFRIAMWSVPFSALLALYSQLLMGLFEQIVVLAVNVLSMVVGASVSYVLIFGKLGCPALGMNGMAWAALVASSTSLACLTGYVASRHKYRMFALWKVRPGELGQSVSQIVRVGGPIVVQMGNEMASFFATTIMVGWMGVEALQAKQVVARYLMLLVLPIFGLSQASTVLVGKQFGGRNFKDMNAYATVCMALGVVYSVSIVVIFLVAPGPFVRLFLGEASDAQMRFVGELLVITAIGQIFDSLRNVATGALRGLQITRLPMIVGVVSIWGVGVPLAYVMGFTWGMGLVGMAIAHTASMAGASAVHVVLWSRAVRSQGTTSDMPASGIEPAAIVG